MALVVLTAGVLWGVVIPQGLAARDSNWIAGMYAVKEQMVERASSPRLIIVSGSSGLFGISAKALEQQVGIPVINFSTHAGLGAEYLLERARRVARTGDTVLLSLEYELLHPANRPSIVLTRFVSSNDLPYLTQEAWWRLPYYFAGHDHESLIWAAIERLGLWSYKEHCYGSAKSLGSHGDETCTDIGGSGGRSPRHIGLQNAISSPPFTRSSAVAAIEDFIAWGNSKDIRTVLSFPPLAQHPDYETDRYGRYFMEIFNWADSLGSPVVGRPGDFLYAAEHIYDTRYHLHAKGRALHSRILGTLLCQQVFAC